MKTKNNSNCKSQSSTPITSKYFTQKIGMDDSLKDFQEPKKNSRGPKINYAINKTKGNKKGKKPKGQSDIRTALRKNKNELIAYNNDFNEICREGGVDVDSEHLQIAIAMSKSLQQNEGESSRGSSKVSSMSSQERLNKMRTTLLEYGFHVPDIKISTIGNKKKGKRKPSKLLLTSEDEKQQLISDKYSQILFTIKNNVKKNNNVIKEYDFIFDICTNRTFEHLKDDDIFYLKKLFEPSNHNICSLLRDWSEIPGRPISPTQKDNYDLKFSDVVYTQEELDVILSGRLNETKNVVKSKQNINNIENQGQLNSILIMNTNNNENVNHISLTIESDDYNQINQSQQGYKNTKEITDFKKDSVIRSLSPDMFDDSEFTENDNVVEEVNMSIKQLNLLISEPTLSGTRNKTNDCMDLTECIKPNSGVTNAVFNNCNNYITNLENITCSQNSEKSFTRRKSDDFMELTECIKPHAKISCIVEESIDLTQDLYDSEMVSNDKCEASASIDLTQSTDSNDSTLPYVDIKGLISVNNRNTNEFISSNIDNIIEKENNDLYGISSISIITPVSNDVLLNRVSSDTSKFDDFVYSHSDHSGENSEKSKYSIIRSNLTSVNENSVNIYDEKNADLKQTSVSSEEIPNYEDSLTTSLYCERSEIKLTKLFKHDNIIITDCNNRDTTNNTLKSISKLGKYNDESIDYSEEYISSNKIDLSKYSLHTIERSNEQIYEKDNSNLSSSHCSTDVVFDISDEELDYSMHKSKFCKDITCDNIENVFETGDKLNNEINLNNSKMTTINNCSDISLPAAEIKGTKVKIKSPIKELTPLKKKINDIVVSIETPKNSDYIIKANNVTPMMNYDTFTTPEINRELNKYGLKTFKRKRAIQLLQHVYNQTHPIIENCLQNEVSFRKRFKPDITESNPSNNNPSFSKQDDKFKTVSQNNVQKSMKPQEVLISNEKENLLYEVTEELPSIRDVQCEPDDWVFQKREKAKLHSCRIPLHIVFHNYVGCRRRLQEAILRYEPIQIDVIHKELVGYGYKFDSKDLLKYLDKKCITVKTSDNNTRNTKQTQYK